MAKKQAAAKAAPKVEVVQPEIKATNEMVEVVIEKPQPKKDEWEIKDRVYYFDEEKGYEREVKYCQNQTTPFVDEMKGDQRLEHIVFRSGSLFVPKEKTVLQKFLSLYHPLKDKVFYEHKPVEIAENQLDWLEFEVEALTIARSMDIDLAEAIMS